MSESPEHEPVEIQDDEATENAVVELRPEDDPEVSGEHASATGDVEEGS